MPPRPLHQDPIAFVLGLEGIALMKAYNGEFDEQFTRRRLEEVRRLVNGEIDLGPAASIRPISTQDGYATWSRVYDSEGNSLLDGEAAYVHPLLDVLPIGTAVDVACGTGRHTEHLLRLGHRTIGVDSSPDMLAIARAKVPDAELHLADLHELPLPDDLADVVVCSLALTHVLDLQRAMTELTRVLKPGGHLVLSDARGLFAGMRPPVMHRHADGGFGYLPHRIWKTGEYLTVALSLGLTVRHFWEPFYEAEPPTPQSFDDHPPTAGADQPPDIWSLMEWAAEAGHAANRGEAGLIVWHLQKGH